MVLTPLDEAIALRPSLAHLATARAESEPRRAAASVQEEDEKPAELQPLTVGAKTPAFAITCCSLLSHSLLGPLQPGVADLL